MKYSTDLQNAIISDTVHTRHWCCDLSELYHNCKRLVMISALLLVSNHLLQLKCRNQLVFMSFILKFFNCHVYGCYVIPLLLM